MTNVREQSSWLSNARCLALVVGAAERNILDLIRMVEGDWTDPLGLDRFESATVFSCQDVGQRLEIPQTLQVSLLRCRASAMTKQTACTSALGCVKKLARQSLSFVACENEERL